MSPADRNGDIARESASMIRLHLHFTADGRRVSYWTTACDGQFHTARDAFAVQYSTCRTMRSMKEAHEDGAPPPGVGR